MPFRSDLFELGVALEYADGVLYRLRYHISETIANVCSEDLTSSEMSLRDNIEREKEREYIYNWRFNCCRRQQIGTCVYAWPFSDRAVYIKEDSAGEGRNAAVSYFNKYKVSMAAAIWSPALLLFLPAAHSSIGYQKGGDGRKRSSRCNTRRRKSSCGIKLSQSFLSFLKVKRDVDSFFFLTKRRQRIAARTTHLSNGSRHHAHLHSIRYIYLYPFFIFFLFSYFRHFFYISLYFFWPIHRLHSYYSGATARFISTRRNDDKLLLLTREQASYIYIYVTGSARLSLLYWCYSATIVRI